MTAGDGDAHFKICVYMHTRNALVFGALIFGASR
jgi:hypothetical protein